VCEVCDKLRKVLGYSAAGERMKSRLLSVLAGAWLAAMLIASPALCEAQIVVSVNFEPPPLPVYEQPPIPAPGWIWTPGYWAWGPDGYFWVPGTWIEPPAVGLLWTPGYWAWSEGGYLWNAGYWGPVVGFYGGINYGFGYIGRGYQGGYWRGNQFYYNTTVNNVTNVHITNVYNRTIVNNVTVTRVSYNGGSGGVSARPTAEEQQAAHQPHTAATSAQTQQREAAGSRRDLLASVNNGKPAIAATVRPNDFSSHVVSASSAGGPVHAAPASERAPAATFNHARDIPRPTPVPEPAAGASAEERDYAHQQSDLQARQEQERQALAQQQEKEHAAFAQQQSQNKEAYAAMERQHTQQTQQMQQRHATEAHQIQRPAAPAGREPPPR
jgi:hypothetical protein